MALVEFTFAGLSMLTDEALLTPRDWTAAQSAWGAELLSQVPAGPVLELCAGAGHIGLAAVHASDRSLVAVDREEVAVARIRANAHALGMAARVETRCGAIAQSLGEPERFPLIIADPPWVPHAAVGRYPADPTGAIDGGPDGLTVARECVELIDRHLAAGGAALLQLGTRSQVTRLDLPQTVVVAEVRDYQRGVVVCLRRPPSASRGAESRAR